MVLTGKAARTGAALGVLWSILLIGCDSGSGGSAASDNDSPDASLAVRIVLNEAVASFAVVVSDLDGEEVAEAVCPRSENDSRFVCRPDGIEVHTPPDRMGLVVKARGFAFVSDTYAVDDLPTVGSHRILDIRLSPLADFEQADTHATGFAEDAFERFIALASNVDTAIGSAKAVKFYIDDFRGDPTVYFQNTPMYPLHYVFAKNVLGDGRTARDFEAETYSGQSRDAAAGVLIYFDNTGENRSGADVAGTVMLNFATYDDISPELVTEVHRLIEARLLFLSLSKERDRLTYMPAGDAKEAEADDAQHLFRSAGIPVRCHRELWGEQAVQLLNEGIAFGILRRLSPEALDNTIVSLSDILVLTRLPAALPPVAGTITEEMQTPLSHVNIAAKTRNTPNMVYMDAGADETLLSLVGEWVRFEIKDGAYSLRAATAAEADAHHASLAKPELTPEYDLSVRDLMDFGALGYHDAAAYGTKAANLGELKTVLGEGAPNGFGVPFYYYDEFVNTAPVTPALCGDAAIDCREEGRTDAVCAAAEAFCDAAVTDGDLFVQSYIERLLEDDGFQTDTVLREALLDGLRYHIRHVELTPETAALLGETVAAVFGEKKVRLRSSTNAEDLALFSGAGLYKSVSAYAFNAEKPVEKQIRKVWASVWNFRAFEERTFWNVDHRAVKMGVAVSTAYPDEAANGVLVTANLANPMEWGMYVNLQLGETSITNPSGGATPEIFSLAPGAGGTTEMTHLAFSSLSPDEPIMNDDEIRELVAVATHLSSHFELYYDTLPLDLEFKLYGPDRDLTIKQARPFIQ